MLPAHQSRLLRLQQNLLVHLNLLTKKPNRLINLRLDKHRLIHQPPKKILIIRPQLLPRLNRLLPNFLQIKVLRQFINFADYVSHLRLRL